MWSFWNRFTERGPSGMKYVNLKIDTIKILGIHSSYNELIVRERIFLKAISNIQGIWKLWIMRQLTIEGRIVIFKILAISKIVYLSLLTNTPHVITDELKKIQKKSLFGLFQHQKLNKKLYVWTIKMEV